MLVALLLACSAPLPAPGDAPAIGTGDEVHVLLAGDIGDETDGRLAVLEGMEAVCGRRSCDAIVLLGDLIYPRGADSPDDPRLERYLLPYTELAPTYLALGNHDYGHGRDEEAVDHLLGWAADQPRVHLPSRVYSARVGDIATLAVMDTNHIFQHGDTPLGPHPSQGSWLDGLERPLLVAGHHPLVSNGRHGNAGAYEGWRHLPWVSGNALRDVLVEHVQDRAWLYASGHDHNLQVLDCGDTRCVVSGAGSKATPLVDRDNPSRFQASTLGFFGLELTATGGQLVAYDAEGTELARVLLH